MLRDGFFQAVPLLNSVIWTLQVQNSFVDNNVNLSVCALEVGMLQPEALNQASSLTVTPLLVSMGSHVNSGRSEY